MVTKIMVGISLILILFFSKTEGNIFKRLFGGITSLYDITGFFGDILSYIRLFGLGTAGGILGMVVNSVAMQFTGIPYVGWVISVLFLIIGHIFVLALSGLGAFVHPLRLTFVEFYKNAGFTGGGKAYKPLSKNEH
jgi:V/A-type H+-transporting ATPase subunit I